MGRPIEKILIFGDGAGIYKITSNLIPYNKETKICIASIRDRGYVIPDFIQPSKTANDYDYFVGKIADYSPDLILVNSYSMRIPQEILDIPEHGAINIHYALLPRYRGANPIQWAIINGEIDVGVTMHYMTNDFDSGDIIAQQPVPIYDYESWVPIVRRCSDVADKLIKQELPKILSGTNARVPQDESRATRYPRRTPEDGEIIWAMPVIDIYNKIRALVKPHPGAFYTNNIGNKIVVDEMKSREWINDMKIMWWKT